MTFENFITTIQAFAQLLGLMGVLVGASVAIAYALFRRFGERWIEARFESRLVAYKHDQQKELEQLRFNINALLDRTIKLHQREFDTLPEAWAKLIDAYYRTGAFISAIQSYPDVAKMSAAQLDEFLKGAQLGEWEKNELRLLPQNERTNYYIKHVYWNRLSEVRTLAVEAHTYIQKNGIFFAPEIKEAFMAASDMVWDALMEDQFSHEHKILPDVRTKRDALNHLGESMLKELESKVYGRIWSKSDSVAPLA